MDIQNCNDILLKPNDHAKVRICLDKRIVNRTIQRRTPYLQPSVRSRLKVTDRSFAHHAPVLWDSVPKQLRHCTLLSRTFIRNHYLTNVR